MVPTSYRVGQSSMSQRGRVDLLRMALGMPRTRGTQAVTSARFSDDISIFKIHLFDMKFTLNRLIE